MVRKPQGMTTEGTEEHRGETLCTLRLAGSPQSVPADGIITSSSTVLSAGKTSVFTSACATVSGCIIFLRGASGQSVFQIAVSVAPGRSAITRIPFSRSSSRSVLVNPSAPCFEAL